MGKYCIYPGCNKEDIAEDGRIPSCEYHKERRIKIVGRVAKVGGRLQASRKLEDLSS